jgi:hypothetical protein
MIYNIAFQYYFRFHEKYIEIIVTEMEGNIRIYRLPKPEAREISVSRFVP